MGMILCIASSHIVGYGDIVGRSGCFKFKLSANSVMRGRVNAIRTFKGLVADLRYTKSRCYYFILSLFLTKSWKIIFYFQEFLQSKRQLRKILLLIRKSLLILSSSFSFLILICLSAFCYPYLVYLLLSCTILIFTSLKTFTIEIYFLLTLQR